MRTQDYRENRVRVTEQIKDTLIKLVEQEKDFEKKKKNPAKWYREEVARVLKLTENNNPSLRSYEEILKFIRKKFQEKNPLDNPWSLGDCLKYDILVDVVIPIQQQLLPYGRFLTIRRARWYSKLHAVLSPLLEKAYPQQPSQNQLRLYQIASYYTRMEQIAEISGKAYLDTRALDNTFFYNQDFSFKTSRRMWEGLYRQIPEKPKVTEKASALKAEQILNKEMTENEARLLNKFIKLQCAYEADEGNLEKADIFVEENPDVQPLAEKWMALTLQRDIKIGGERDGEK